jgi:hypothetical protein
MTGITIPISQAITEMRRPMTETVETTRPTTVAIVEAIHRQTLMMVVTFLLIPTTVEIRAMKPHLTQEMTRVTALPFNKRLH